MGVAAHSRTQSSAAFLLQRKTPGCERRTAHPRRPRGERWRAAPVGLRVSERKAPDGERRDSARRRAARGGQRKAPGCCERETAQGARLREGNSARRRTLCESGMYLHINIVLIF
eukprot:1316212-Pleurochrysis_carterae.AAC.1